MCSFRLGTALTLTLFLHLVVAGFAAGQEQSGKDERPAPNWLVTCTNTGPKAALECSMSQSVVLKTTGARVLTVSVQKHTEKNLPTMMVTLPHRLFLPAGVKMSIDGNERNPLPVQTCDASGCYASLQIDSELLKAMKRGLELKFVIKDLQKRDIDLTLTLIGFSDSFAILER
jgi:invasion protein IalB